MTLTTTGKRFLVVIFLLLGMGLFFQDVFLLAAFVAGALLFVYELVDARSVSRKGRDSVKLNPERFEATLTRGDTSSFKTTLTANRMVALDNSEIPWVRVDPLRFEPGEWPVTLTSSPRFSGLYSTEYVTAHITSRYGFFSIQTRPRLSVEMRVYPRFFVAAFAVLEFLARTSASIGGENETEFIGPGMEYADTRPYQPGDSLRRIDWKATARLSSLMVKKFYREGGGSLNVVYLLETPGPRTHDEMATQFLNLLLSAVSSGKPVNVTAYDGEGIFAQFSGRGSEVLAPALSVVLNKSGVSLDDLYSLLDVVPKSQEKRALLLSGKSKLAELLKDAGGIGGRQSRDSMQFISEISATEPSPSFVILSSLVSRDPLLPELIDQLTSRGHATVIAYPRSPWKDAQNLEEGYLMSITNDKLSKFADLKGCVLVSLPASGSNLVIHSRMPVRIINPTN